MTLVVEYVNARHDEEAARLRRSLALRAMVATGMSQRQIAQKLGISQPAVCQQLKTSPSLDSITPGKLLEAATPVLKALAGKAGYSKLAVFGSVARNESGPGSDIDLLVEVPEGTSSFALIRFEWLIEEVLGREVDLVSYGGLVAGLDDDIRRDAVLL